MTGRTFGQFTVGDTDIYLSAGVTGDLNPAHIDEDYPRGTFFRTRIAQGMLSAGFVSAVIGTRMPGPGSVYIRQPLDFLAPVRIGDTVTATVEVVEKLDEKKRIRQKTTCTNQKGIKVLEGEALVSPPRPSKTS